MSALDPIIPRDDLAHLVEAARLQSEATRALQSAKDEALRLKISAKADGRAEGIADGCAAAAELLAEARSETARQAEALEDTLARLVAETVRTIIGEGEREATVRAALRTALTRLGTEEANRLHVSADMALPVRSALGDVNADLPVIVDDTLPDGTALLSGASGHAHIGLEAQLSASLASFEGAE